MKKKWFAFFVMLAVISAVTVTTVLATDTNEADRKEELRVKETVEGFLTAYLREAYLYEDQDIMLFAVPTGTDDAAGEALTIDGRSYKAAELTKNVEYAAEKARYWSTVRQALGLGRSDLEIDFVYSSMEISGTSAEVSLSAFVSFRYDDHDDRSGLEEIYDMTLVKLDGTWYVADVTETEDWFDSRYKSPSFDASALISETLSANGIEEEVESAPQQKYTAPEADTRESTDASAGLPYNRENAVAYAYTYSNTSSTNYLPYYNDNFQYFSSDCMNFASQCLWAGYGGNNCVEAINGHKVPMDVSGVYEYEWYSSKNQGVHSASWSNCGSFLEYLDRPASDTGLRGNVYSIGSGSFATVSNWSEDLLGSVLLVPGASVDYGHAVFVTGVSGSDRTQVEFCAHTAMAQGLKVSDRWPHGNIKVIVPTENNCASSLPYPNIRADLHKPVSVNSSLTLTAHTDITCYWIITEVTSPSGEVKMTRQYGTANSSYVYTFEEPGLYTIKVEAKTDGAPTGNEYDYYYTIRVY